MTNQIKRDERMPLIEQIREITFEATDPDDMLDFVPAGLALGCTMAKAEALDEQLTIRMMRARGAI